jgi:hypothetical protein
MGVVDEERLLLAAELPEDSEHGRVGMQELLHPAATARPHRSGIDRPTAQRRARRRLPDRVVRSPPPGQAPPSEPLPRSKERIYRAVA